MPHTPEKDDDFTFTEDFMIRLFRLLYVYECVAKEIATEDMF